MFEALAHTPAFQAHGVSPAQMAAATAEQCFEEADEDGNGTLTFDDFKAWYERDQPAPDEAEFPPVPPKKQISFAPAAAPTPCLSFLAARALSSLSACRAAMFGGPAPALSPAHVSMRLARRKDV